MMLESVVIAGAAEVPYQRHPADSVTTRTVLAEALVMVLESAGLEMHQIDGLGVSSHNLKPDHVMDLAWHLGLRRLRWAMDGPPAMNVVLHAVSAVRSGEASAIVVVAGDRATPQSFEKFVSADYNVAHALHLSQIPLGGPNPLFALVTQAHMDAHGLTRETYGHVVISQRRWAATNPGATYRDPLTMKEYLAAPMVADPLCLLDCVPLVAGADAIIVAHPDLVERNAVAVRAARASVNWDNQEGAGINTGLIDIGPLLWDDASMGPADMDIVAVYDDYPVVVLAQLEDLGFVDAGDIDSFVRTRLASGDLPVNTSGGMLTAGQAGSASTIHGLVECVRQLRGERGIGQLENARRAIAVGYGMIPYRYGTFTGGVILEVAP